MLEPGTWLEVNAGGHVKQGKFFEFPPFRESELRGEKAYEAVNDAVTNAVRRQLVSNVPVGTFLSGGIDSPLVAAKMRAVTTGSLRAFTMATDGNRLDESPDAIAYVREIDVEHTIEHVPPEKALTLLDDVVDCCGEPFADYSVFPMMLISRLARQHVKVMLSGDGGNGLFWGYADRFASALDKSSAFRPQPYRTRTLRRRIARFLNTATAHANLRHDSIGEWYRTVHTRIPEE